ncbi:MAG: uracil phosphoribosyltransferase [Raoultibacter sp.]|jgi:uracil phosphoribosyltransferase
MAPQYDRVTVLDHPLIQHKLTLLRAKETSMKDFRQLLRELSILEGYEATKNLPLIDFKIETPIQPMIGQIIEGTRITVVPILRAGLGMLEGVLELLPSARVGHLGMYRDPETHEPVEYYAKLPEGIQDSRVYVIDPILATGGSAEAAIANLRARGVKDVTLLVIVAAPEGVERVLAADPDVHIYTCTIDDGLNENAYIVPGLGDAGDRISGTI